MGTHPICISHAAPGGPKTYQVVSDPGGNVIALIDPTARGLLRRTIGSCAQLTDLSPLADMTRLQTLEIVDAAKVTDLRPLSKLVNLTSLNLSGNGATDISPLATLKKLTRLNLSGNDNLRDLAPLSSLTELKRLSVYNCPQLQIETIDKLQLALPNCEIIIEPPTR